MLACRRMVVVAAVILVAATLPWCQAGLPLAAVPEGLGVNIHFTGEPERDLDMIQAAGFRFVRMDLTWEAVEKERGIYNFTAYDHLTEGLAKRQIRPLYILAYSNKLYEKERSIQTEDGRQSFALFASEAARHFQGKGVIWELWNEPNLNTFWGTQPAGKDYMALVKVVVPAIRKADPRALVVAPATSGIPLDFLEECFKQGLLDLADGLTIHPYRQTAPETVIPDVLRLRALVTRYAPDRPDFPILSGEWGYSGVWDGFNDQRQGEYMPRQYLVNMSLGIPLSIWYDWRDDGADPKDPEHHFGTVTRDFQPKPAYVAAQKMVQSLSGLQFVKRLESPQDDYLMLFGDSRRSVVAAWTMGAPHEVALVGGQKTSLGGGVEYVEVPATATNLVAEGAWTAKPRSPAVACGAPGDRLAPELTIAVRNPFAQKVPVEVKITAITNLAGQFVGPASFELEPGKESSLSWKGKTPERRDQARMFVTVEVNLAGIQRRQTVDFAPANPLSVGVARGRDAQPAAVLCLGDGDRIRGELICRIGGTVRALGLDADASTGKCSVTAPEGNGPEKIQGVVAGNTMVVPVPWKANWTQDVVRFQVAEQGVISADSGGCRIVPLDVGTNTVTAIGDGDAKVAGRFGLSSVPCADPGAPAERVLKLSYEFGSGWKFVRLAPAQDLAVDRAPSVMSVWVKGNKSDCRLNMRIVDAAGRVFQPTFGKLDYTGWRLMTVRLDDPTVSHWGGTGPGESIQYPVRINTFVLVDGTKSALQDEVSFANFCLVYRE